ncbi:MAG: hypothetical protein AAGA16_05985 [Cyanobacteria bacterium P01_E01_bin.35]
MKSSLIIGLMTISIGSITHHSTIAQTSTEPLPAQPNNPNLSLPLLQAAPLLQATSKLLAQPSYQLESKGTLTSMFPDRSQVADAQILTTVAAPNKVNSEITLINPNDTVERKYQIISDGVQVWIYDVNQKQYSISDYQQFIQSQSAIAVGTVANFYLKTLDQVNNNKIAARAIAILPPDRLLRYFQRFINLDLQNMAIRTEQLKAKTYSVYDINAADHSYEVTAYVTSQSADIERVDLSKTKDGLALKITEEIISQTAPETIPKDLFSFDPPDNAEQITKQIALPPF